MDSWYNVLCVMTVNYNRFNHKVYFFSFMCMHIIIIIVVIIQYLFPAFSFVK